MIVLGLWVYFAVPDQFATIIHMSKMWSSKFGFPNKNTHTTSDITKLYEPKFITCDNKKQFAYQAELLHENKQPSLGIFHQ